MRFLANDHYLGRRGQAGRQRTGELLERILVDGEVNQVRGVMQALEIRAGQWGPRCVVLQDQSRRPEVRAGAWKGDPDVA